MAIQRYRTRRPSYREFTDVPSVFSRLFDEPFFTETRAGRWMPAVAVSETNDELLLTAELPGMSENDITIELENNVLTVSGEKAEEHEEESEERKFHVYERSYGSFTRAFTLPANAVADRVNASFQDGVLTVEIPKADEAKPRTVRITS